MSAPGPGDTDKRQQSGVLGPGGMSYVFTEEEQKVFSECVHESFWYRSLPFSVVGMAITQACVAKGFLSASPRFGSFPKVVFAAVCGYFAGKISYMETCKNKFLMLENSPLGEALRKQSGLPQQNTKTHDADTSMQSLATMFQSDTQSQTPAESRDYGFAYSPDPPMQVEQDVDLRVSDQQYMDEEPRQKPILYEDLRHKNRENYEVTLVQKAETLMKPSPERPKKEVKKNIYGDAWEE